MALVETFGITGTADRYGVSSLTVPFRVDTLEEVLAFLGSRPGFKGLALADGSEYRQTDDGAYDLIAKFEGIPPDASPSDVAMAQFRFSGTQEKESIKTHPKFLSLKEKFGWDEENQEFPEIAPDQASEDGLPGDSTANDDADKISPVAGQNSWLVVGAEYTVTFVARTVPSSIFLGVNAIIKNPPGIANFNLSLGKRNFIKLAPEVDIRGNVVQITLRYQLSGPRGAPKEVYEAGQLDPESDGDQDSAINQPISAW